MRQLSNQQIDLAITSLEKLRNSRGMTQTELAQISGVHQPTISKITAGSQVPSVEVLKKLFQAVGLKLGDVLNETEGLGHEILGYLATPLTGVAKDEKSDSELRRVIDKIKDLASSSEFSDLPFDLYWPGDFTHPIKNPGFPAGQVYLTDRSRASTHDFVILFCAEPSFGVGQENEIATQVGIPAIRLIPEVMSRMMLGSFIKRVDVKFSGSLRNGIKFNEAELLNAFREIRRLYFQNRLLFKGMNGVGFGERLRKLIDARSGGKYLNFAEQLGVDISYLNAMMDDHPSVSNPGLRLLKKMAAILQEDVGYLIGESEEADPIWTDSKTSWHAWATETPGLDAALAINIRDEWRDNYRAQKAQPSVASYRKPMQAMQKTDWDALYKKKLRESDAEKPRLF
jgi:transcriptional regulator with XRE-family HTH domain